MFRGLRHRLTLNRLLRKKSRLSDDYSKTIREARESKKSPGDLDALMHEASWEEQVLDEEIAALVTDYHVARARRQFLPVPDHKDGVSWEECFTYSNRHVLTPKGMAELRATLRSERKAKFELTLMVLAAITGLVGAVTGLVAVLAR